jgi:hypothetical protein
MQVVNQCCNTVIEHGEILFGKFEIIPMIIPKAKSHCDTARACLDETARHQELFDHSRRGIAARLRITFPIALQDPGIFALEIESLEEGREGQIVDNMLKGAILTVFKQRCAPDRMRDVSPPRSDLRAGGPPAMRDLSSAARSSSPRPELRELPRGRGEDGPRASRRVCDLSSSARTRRTDHAPELRELPRGHDAPGPASHPTARRLHGLPHRTRSDSTCRSQDLRDLSSRSRESRARGAVLRRLPSVQSGQRSTVSADLEIAGWAGPDSVDTGTTLHSLVARTDARSP